VSFIGNKYININIFNLFVEMVYDVELKSIALERVSSSLTTGIFNLNYYFFIIFAILEVFTYFTINSSIVIRY
jgi:hypothetical protein